MTEKCGTEKEWPSTHVRVHVFVPHFSVQFHVVGAGPTSILERLASSWATFPEVVLSGGARQRIPEWRPATLMATPLTALGRLATLRTTPGRQELRNSGKARGTLRGAPEWQTTATKGFVFHAANEKLCGLPIVHCPDSTPEQAPSLLRIPRLTPAHYELQKPREISTPAHFFPPSHRSVAER